MQLYEDINQGGRSVTICGVGYSRPDFSGWNENLFLWDSWDNRVSSYQTFNFLGHNVRFWDDPKYAGRYLNTDGQYNTETLSDLTQWNRNDSFSSVKINL